MPTYKSSVSIEQTPEAVFDFVSDVRTLPRYYDGISSVEPLEGGVVRVTSMSEGRPVVREGWFRVHEGHRRRVEWGTEDERGYGGFLEVDPEGEVCSVTIEIHGPDSGSVDEQIDRTLYALKAEVEHL